MALTRAAESALGASNKSNMLIRLVAFSNVCYWYFFVNIPDIDLASHIRLLSGIPTALLAQHAATPAKFGIDLTLIDTTLPLLRWVRTRTYTTNRLVFGRCWDNPNKSTELTTDGRTGWLTDCLTDCPSRAERTSRKTTTSRGNKANRNISSSFRLLFFAVPPKRRHIRDHQSDDFHRNPLRERCIDTL